MGAGFSGLKISISGYISVERKQIGELVQFLGTPASRQSLSFTNCSLGAKFMESFNRQCTHLICNKGEGMKYDLAAKLGTPCVSPQWLFDCALGGRLAPVSNYTVAPIGVTAVKRDSGKLVESANTSLVEEDDSASGKNHSQVSPPPKAKATKKGTSSKSEAVKPKLSLIESVVASSNGRPCGRLRL